MYYWWHTLQMEWIHECNPNLALDDDSITEVTGYNPGVYTDMWLLPSRLVGQLGSDNTSFSPSGEVCYLGPILCTLTIDSDGSVESIVPTMNNGGYFDGEELILIHSREQALGLGDKYIRVNLETGSSVSINYMGNAYWAPVNYLENETWASSVYKRFFWGTGRMSAFEDVRCHMGIKCQYERNQGSTSWYSWNYYAPTGWDELRGRCDLTGSYQTAQNHSIDYPTNADNTYEYVCYRNTTPGSEVFFFTSSKYSNSGPGLYRIDTTDHFIGDDYFGRYGIMNGDDTCPWSTTYTTADAVFGYTSNYQGYYYPTTANYLKPWRTLESDNFMIGGGNENLAICSSSTIAYAPVYSSDYTVAFSKIATNICGRVSAS